MIQLLVVLVLAICLFTLVRRGLIQVDLSFPWMTAIIVLGFFSLSEEFVSLVAGWLGILYPPIAVVFLTIFVIFALITVLLVGLTRLRDRQIKIVRYLAAVDLARQEQARPSQQTSRNTST